MVQLGWGGCYAEPCGSAWVGGGVTLSLVVQLGWGGVTGGVTGGVNC